MTDNNAFYPKEDSSPAFTDAPLFEDHSSSEDHEKLEDFLQEETHRPFLPDGSKQKFSIPNPFLWIRKQLEHIPIVRTIAGTLIYAAVFLAWSSAVVLLVFTFMQFSNRDSTTQGSKLYAIGSSESGCSAVQDRPIRFRFLQDPEYLYCAWRTKNQVYRILFCLAGIASPALCILALKKQKRWMMWIFAVLSLLEMGAWFFTMCVDSNDVRVSSDWCEGGLQGMQLSPPGVQLDCNYWPYVLTCLLDAGAVLLWALTVFSAVRHVRHHMVTNSGFVTRGVI